MTIRPFVPSPWKVKLPARKSSFAMSRVEATKPAVSIVTSCPKTTPFGLMRKTCPLETSWPMISETSPPTTRLSTAEFAASCWKRVISSWAMENACQSMIAPGEFVTVSSLPMFWKSTVPWTTVAPDGLPRAGTAGQKIRPATAVPSRDWRRRPMGRRVMTNPFRNEWTLRITSDGFICVGAARP